MPSCATCQLTLRAVGWLSNGLHRIVTPANLRLHSPSCTAGLSDMTTRTVRDKFARLSQMATLLTLEAVRRRAADGLTGWDCLDPCAQAVCAHDMSCAA